MAPRDVHDVDVVAAARAVLRVEVAAVHEQLHGIAGKMYEHQSWYKKHTCRSHLVAPAHGHLGHVGHEVVGCPLRVLADHAARVRPHRVEIPQQRAAPVRVGRRHVLSTQLM